MIWWKKTNIQNGTPIQNRSRILMRTVILTWFIILFTLLIFVSFLVVYQKEQLTENLNIQGRMVFTSLADVTASSIVVEDFSLVVDHCMTVVSQNPSILYIVITRNDGFSLVHLKDKWCQKQLDSHWHPENRKFPTEGHFDQHDIAPGLAYHIAFPFSYSGIDWGWIHVGLSPDQYYRDLNRLGMQILGMVLISAFFGFVISYLFAKRLIRPIQLLNQYALRVAQGDLTAKVSLSTRDELQNLADSFNWMTQSLQESQNTLISTRDYVENILHSMKEMIFVLDSDMLIQKANRAAEEILGYRRDDLIGCSLNDIFIGKKITVHDLCLWVKNSVSINQEASCRTKKGKTISVLLSYAALNDTHHEGSHFVIIAMDITERKILEKQLYRSQKMEAIGQLAGGVAHNLNNLLTGILGNQKLAFYKATVEVREYLKKSEESALRAAALIEELLSFSRKTSVYNSMIDVNSIVKEIASLIQKTFAKNIKIVVQTENDLPPVVGDISQLHTVIMNLCLNAKDAIAMAQHEYKIVSVPHPEYQITMSTKLLEVEPTLVRAHSVSISKQWIVLSITDNGIGMDESMKEHVFEPFFTTKKEVGTGLGLASSFGIIKQHQGWIDYVSAYGEGTTFRIYLPVTENS